MKRLFSLILALALLAAVLSGCGGSGPERPPQQVTVALWSDQLTEHYSSYLRERFPEVDFNFYVATNSTDFYRFKMERGDLPDILTVRRFALRDVADWKDSLLDLSDTELANTFPQSYLRSYTYSDGTVNWLPSCAEVDGILVNRTLLEEHGLALPTTYPEFAELCRALTELGIRPFRSNFGADYTCMEILQGLSVDGLTAQAGREWRQQYESGRTNQLSGDIWLPVFQRMADFIQAAGLDASDLTDQAIDIYTAYQNGETAMIRGTYGEAVVYGVEERSVLLPYLGGQPEDSWYLTYPAFQIAAGARGTEDPARKALILDIMAAMLDQGGQENIENGRNIIPYNRGVELKLAPELESMRPYVEANRLYIRLASADMFSASKTVVQGMIGGTYPDARSAFGAFNDLMNAETADSLTYPVDAAYAYAFDPRHGSQAASAVMNTVREEVGTQLLIGPASAVAGNITAGDYTLAELGFLTMGESPSIALCEMTGEQLYQYTDYVLTTPGKRGAVCNNSTLYVSSGFEMALNGTEAGYSLEKLTIDGRELDRGTVYSVAALGSMEMMLKDALDAAGVAAYTLWDVPYKRLVVNRLAEGRQLAPPSDYITLR